ncbi:general secretion pathway protein N [Rhodothalassium salexigens DSM 2132]|uniref:Type II secretion system protein N n=1 Tax=Rhodothalassium salexigens DSM 2132 TaxID=1188247 RepID=A0A4R2PTC1_RHOSA|nr:type II secretion system protein N [Rhodothalassium salexigens]MBB4210210.1 hypothetical protein [Rhodothalassium salexigens DSM 2132]MBK1638651.1 hypothetical protein [Rhodothalassium salexigens DSM 2132]TCP38374.1 general secretion pathway protein N [Rhodothalassium salexigens DSM 2132]
MTQTTPETVAKTGAGRGLWRRRSVRLGLVFVAVLLAALVATVPLSVAVRLAGLPAGVAHGGAHGTVWGGRLEAVRVHGADLGRVQLALRPLALLSGRWRLDWFADGRSALGQGRLETGLLGGGWTLSRTRLQVDLADMGLPLPVAPLGRAWLEAERLVWRADGCGAAEATAGTDVLAANAEALNWRGPRLDGPVQCQAGRLVARLTGATPAGGTADPASGAGTTEARLTLSVAPEGLARARLRLAGDDPRLGFSLPLVGFERRDGGYVLEMERAWR